VDTTTSFVQWTNIENFSNKFAVEPNPEKREVLRGLLLEEENKYGHRAKHLDLANSRISEGQRRVAKQRELISTLAARGHDTGKAEQLLHNLVTLLDLFREFRAVVVRGLERNEL
jgi:hypothetical protein